jgi:hypothetical protein
MRITEGFEANDGWTFGFGLERADSLLTELKQEPAAKFHLVYGLSGNLQYLNL